MNTYVRRMAVVAVAAMAVLAVVWYFVLWGPQSHHLKAAHAARAAAEAQITQLSGQTAQLERLVRQIPADEAKYAEFQSDVPDTPTLDTALRQIHQTAQATGVAVTSVGPSVPAGTATTNGPSQASPQGSTTSAVPNVVLSITAGGTEPQLESFISQLTNLSQTHRVFVVDHLEFSGTGALSASLTVRIFYVGQPTP